MNLGYKQLMLAFLFGILILFSISSSSALNKTVSNQSIQAKQSIDQAQKDIFEMMSKNISIKRVNETYQEAIQIYSAQIALEEKGGNPDYKIVIRDASDISSIKKIALQAKDELAVFEENYQSAKKESDLSAFQNDYNSIMTSFSDERFEDTLTLINKGYTTISQIQSEQTTTNAVYLATSKTVKDFFIQNWFVILITCSVTLFLPLIFWNTLIKLKMKIKLNNLIVQKKAINGLIKEMQSNYFKTKKMSETEYNIKLKKYDELLRDIDRQVMVLREGMLKRNKAKEKFNKT